MKKTVNVAIGGCSFIIDEDAYIALDNYLDRFRTAMNDSAGGDDVMEELESRIADLMKQKLVSREVVNLKIVEEIIAQIGYPEGYNDGSETNNEDNMNAPRKFFRDSEDKKIAGVCSGLALYLGIDVVFVRIIFLVALICGTAGFWAYIIFWVVAPETRTAVEKCELRGLPPTAENIRRFTTNQ
ncbi:MAG: PspC domain-containing protein [Bacteroidales bacterium]|nr:PspC domain-containing protein [Bacteroidales bacterium]